MRLPLLCSTWSIMLIYFHLITDDTRQEIRKQASWYLKLRNHFIYNDLWISSIWSWKYARFVPFDSEWTICFAQVYFRLSCQFTERNPLDRSQSAYELWLDKISLMISNLLAKGLHPKRNNYWCEYNSNTNEHTGRSSNLFYWPLLREIMSWCQLSQWSHNNLFFVNKEANEIGICIEPGGQLIDLSRILCQLQLAIQKEMYSNINNS